MSAAERAGARAADAMLRFAGREAVALAAARNASEANPHVCHSHDICDANVFMAAALEAEGIDDGSANWDAAWAALRVRLAELGEG